MFRFTIRDVLWLTVVVGMGGLIAIVDLLGRPIARRTVRYLQGGARTRNRGPARN